MSVEQDYRAVQDAGMAARDLESTLPALKESIEKQYKRVRASMAAHDDVLDPQVAVQAWYAVMAAMDVETMLKRIVKKGHLAARRLENT